MKNCIKWYFFTISGFKFWQKSVVSTGWKKLINLLIIKDNFFIQKMPVFIKKNLSKIAKKDLL